MKKKILCLVLSLFFIFGATSCSNKNAAVVNKEDLDIPSFVDNGECYETRADMPPDLTDRHQVELYLAAGFNYAPYTEDYTNASEVEQYGENSKYIKGLKLCEELGLNLYIRPHSSYTSSTVTTMPNYFEQYFSTIDFTDYPAVKGFFIVDEPVYGQLVDVEARYLNWFNNNYGNKGYKFLINLFGCHTINWKTGNYKDKTYNDYAEKCLSIIDGANSIDKRFSIDFYPLQQNGVVPQMNEFDLKVNQDAAERAKTHDINFAAYVQVFGGNADGSCYRIPTTYAEVNWSLYNILSFGARTLQFFCYREYKKDGLVGMITDGEPNERYYWVQQALTTLQKFDHVLLSYSWDHLFTNIGTGSRNAINPAFEHVKSVVKPITDVNTVKSKYDITINEFKNAEDEKAFMLLNYDDPITNRKNKVSINFDKAQGVMYYRNGELITQVLDNKTFEIELEAGEGIFVIPLYKK